MFENIFITIVQGKRRDNSRRKKSHKNRIRIQISHPINYETHFLRIMLVFVHVEILSETVNQCGAAGPTRRLLGPRPLRQG